jgi:hypothetical protein
VDFQPLNLQLFNDKPDLHLWSRQQKCTAASFLRLAVDFLLACHVLKLLVAKTPVPSRWHRVLAPACSWPGLRSQAATSLHRKLLVNIFFFHLKSTVTLSPPPRRYVIVSHGLAVRRKAGGGDNKKKKEKKRKEKEKLTAHISCRTRLEKPPRRGNQIQERGTGGEGLKKTDAVESQEKQNDKEKEKGKRKTASASFLPPTPRLKKKKKKKKKGQPSKLSG